MSQFSNFQRVVKSSPGLAHNVSICVRAGLSKPRLVPDTERTKDTKTLDYASTPLDANTVLAAGAMSHETKHLCPSFGRAWGRADWACVRFSWDSFFSIFKAVTIYSEMVSPVLFDIYRYQILPTSKNIQLNLDSTVATIEDLVMLKNAIFKSILLDKRIVLDGRRSKVVHKIDEQSDTVFLMQIGSEKGVQIINEDFSIEKVPSYPNTHVIFENDPDRQFCLVQQNTSAFAETETVINILERNLNRYLDRYQLRIYIKPLFNEYDFWNLIDQYDGRVIKLRFEFIKHNLANIAKTLPEGFKRLQSDINSHKATLITEAPKRGVLEVDKDNQELNGLVDYSKNGGGDIGIKVRGIRAEFKTSKTKRKVEIDEIVFQSSEQLNNFIKDFNGNT